MMYVALTYDHRLIDGREAVSVPEEDQVSRGGPLCAPARCVDQLTVT